MLYETPVELGPPLDWSDYDVHGVWAYRYKSYFFRTFLRFTADIHNAGIRIARSIPTDPDIREGWICQVIRSIENELQWRAKHGLSTATLFSWSAGALEIPSSHPVENRDQVAFMDIVPVSDQGWLRPEVRKNTWTYVLDLEECALTINDYIHFTFSSIPFDLCRYIRTLSLKYSLICMLAPDTPSMHVARVRRWSTPFLLAEPEQVAAYDALFPVVVPLNEWGVRGWANLTTSEALSVHLVSTILLDQSSQIRNPHILSERRMFNYYQWQVITAAAPSAVALSPSVKWADFDEVNCDPIAHIALDIRQRIARSSDSSASGCQEHWDEPPPMWFRDCLVVLCRRLDTPEFVKAEVFRLAQALDLSRRSSAVGLLFDGEFVVGVALDSIQLRHSPALCVYDSEMRLREGMLLLMHLLSPTLAVDKTPWRASMQRRNRSSLPLPLELVTQIAQLVDQETYSTLRLVSRAFRSIYLTYPRLDNIILLGTTTHGFRVLDALSGEKYDASLYRARTSPYQDTMNQSFYHIQRGPGIRFYTPRTLALWHHEWRQMGKVPYWPDGPDVKSMFKTRLRVWGQYRVMLEEEEEWEAPLVKSQVVLGTWEFRRLEGTKTWGYAHTPWSECQAVATI